MALITRITRLFTADFHAVLDRLEEPEILLKQALREMEEDLSRQQQCVKQLQLEYEQLSARQGATRASLQKVDEELDICFASDEQALARSITRRKLEAERLSNSIASTQENTRLALVEQQNLLLENRSRLQNMRHQAELLSAETPAANTVTSDISGGIVAECSITDDEVEVAYLREKQNRSRP